MPEWLDKLKPSNFRRPEKPRQPELHPFEMAQVVREVQLNMMEYGVLGSNQPVPSERNPQAIKVPNLLQYSKIVKEHWQTLLGVLNTPRQFQISESPDLPWRNDSPDGDVYYANEEPNHVFYLANHLSSPYLNAWKAALSKIGEPKLTISIMENNYNHNGVWMVNYVYKDGSNDDTSPNNVSASLLNPERKMLLHFWYSPQRLDGSYFLHKTGLAPSTREYSTYTGEETIQGFRHFNFHYDASGHANEFEKHQDMIENLNQVYAAYLRKKKNLDYSIVELGLVEMGGQKYWVYSGSEQTALPATQKQANLSRATRNTFGYSTG